MQGSKTHSQDVTPTREALETGEYATLLDEFEETCPADESYDRRDLAIELWVALENPEEMVREARACRE